MRKEKQHLEVNSNSSVNETSQDYIDSNNLSNEELNFQLPVYRELNFQSTKSENIFDVIDEQFKQIELSQKRQRFLMQEISQFLKK